MHGWLTWKDGKMEMIVRQQLKMVDYTDLLGWERFFSELSSFLSSINRQRGTANEDFSEFVVERLQMCIMSVSTLIHHLQSNVPSDGAAARVGAQYSAHLAELLECLRSMLQEWQDYLDHYQLRSVSSFHASASVAQTASQPGRPRFDISREQLQYLRSMSFTWVQISEILGVSYMTVYRRRREYGMMENPDGNITDSELHEILRLMRRELPTLGQTLVWGRLRSLGFKVTRARVREAMKASDPIHTALRWREITPRRPYSVPGPNSLWHIGMLLQSQSHTYT